MEFKTKIGTLKNGIRYVITNDPSAKSSAVMILVRYGAAFSKKSGLAHLLEHLVFKGTKKRPNTKNIMLGLNSIGANYNAYTSKTFTAYHAKTILDYLDEAMDILVDMVKSPKFITMKKKDFLEEFTQEKHIVLQELLTIRDNNARYLDELIEKNIFSDRLGYNCEDDIKDLKSITIDDIIAAYKEFYCAENIIVSISGNFSNTPISYGEKLIDKYFNDFIKGTKSKCIYDKPKSSNKIKFVDILKKKNIEKCNISLAFRHSGYKNIQEFYLIELFSLIFANLTSGRLFQNIREKEGLVYSIRGLNYCYDHLGYLSIATNTSPDNLEKVIKLIKKEIESVKLNGLTEKEFEICKNNYKSKLSLDSENSMTIAEYNAYELFFRSKDFIEYPSVISLINKITLDEINHFIKSFLNQKPIITVIKNK